MRTIFAAFVVVVGASAMAGCNVGMAPRGPDLAEVKQKEASLPPQQQIQMIRSSPMPAPEKAQRIAEVEQKYNIKAEAQSPTPGPPTK